MTGMKRFKIDDAMRLTGAGVGALFMALVLISCGDEDTVEQPPGETCLTGYCVKRTSGELAGVTKPKLCAETFCAPASMACKAKIHVSASASTGGDGSQASPLKDLAAAAKKAKDGDCVLVAAGSYSGATFSGGVKILGAGAKQVDVKPGAGAVKALVLQSGNGGMVRGLSIGGAAVGLYLSQAASLKVEQVRIDGALEVGLYATKATSLTMKQVTVARVKASSSSTSPGAAMGVVLLEESKAKMRGVLLDENDQLGLVALNSAVDMADSLFRRNGAAGGAGSGGAVIACNDRKVAACGSGLASQVSSVEFLENKGIGLLATAAKLDLTQLTVSKTKLGGGAARGLSIHGNGLSSMAVTLKSSTISDGVGQGVVLDGATGVGDDPDPILLTVEKCTVSGNKDRGIWLQRLGAKKGSVKLEKNTLSGNWLMGLGGVQIKGVSINGGTVSGTKKTSIMSGGKSLEMGDGIQVMDQSAVTVAGVAFKNNERLSLLFDGSSGQATGNTFAPAAGAKKLVLQNGADKTVTASGNKDSTGAEIKGTVPAAPFGLNKSILSAPSIPSAP